MKILFTNDCNGFEGHDPYAMLYEYEGIIPSPLLFAIMKQIEYTQLGVMRRGGDLGELETDLVRYLNIKIKKISSGRKSDYPDETNEYKLVSGNY